MFSCFSSLSKHHVQRLWDCVLAAHGILCWLSHPTWMSALQCSRGPCSRAGVWQRAADAAWGCQWGLPLLTPSSPSPPGAAPGAMAATQPGASLQVGGFARSAAGQLLQEKLLVPFPCLLQVCKVGPYPALLFLRLEEPGPKHTQFSRSPRGLLEPESDTSYGSACKMGELLPV